MHGDYVNTSGLERCGHPRGAKTTKIDHTLRAYLIVDGTSWLLCHNYTIFSGLYRLGCVSLINQDFTIMPETLILRILEIVGALITGIIIFTLGQHAERKKQSLLIRADMLKPLNEWLKGAEKIIGIFSDTISTVIHDLPSPINYDFVERKRAFNYMAEKTNEVLGIISSNCLQTTKSKKFAEELSDVIITLDRVIKNDVLQKESEIVFRSTNGTLSNSYLHEAGHLKLQVDSLLQKAYSLEAQIKTIFT